MIIKETLNERVLDVQEILESDVGKLPSGVLCRVRYPICNLGELNRNKRIYERAVFEKVLNDPEIIEKMKRRKLFAASEHPEGMQTSTNDVAGIVTELYIDDKTNKVYAVMEVLDTFNGRNIGAILNGGCQLGVSTRAEGELEECIDESKGKYYKVLPEAYRFQTVDWTGDESTYGAYPETVERKMIDNIKNGLESKKIDDGYATMLLETMKCKEAIALLESIKNPSNTEIKEVAVMSNKEIIQRVKDATSMDSENWKKKYPNEEYCDYKINSNERKISEDTKSFGGIEVEVKREDPEYDGPVYDTYRGDIQVAYSTDPDHGAVADGMRGASRTEISDIKIENVVDSDGNPVELTPEIEAAFEEKAGEMDLSEKKLDENMVRTTSLSALFNAFDKARNTLDESVAAKLKESKTVGTFLGRVFRLLREMSNKYTIAQAERDKLVEIADLELSELKSRYAKDTMALTEKYENVLKEMETVKADLDGVEVVGDSMEVKNEEVVKLKKENETLKESHKTEIENIKKKIGEAVLKDTKAIYEQKFKEIRNRYEKELKEARSHFERRLFSKIVELKVRESGLELDEKSLALLKSCKTEEEVDRRIEHYRCHMLENSFHSDDGEALVIEDNLDGISVDEGTRTMLGKTKMFISSMK